MIEEYNFDIENYAKNIDGKNIIPVLIKYDCDKSIVKFAYDIVFEALEKFRIEKSISEFLKTKFDEKYDKTWHCVVGEDYSVSLTHDSRCFIFFMVDKYYVLLFKL